MNQRKLSKYIKYVKEQTEDIIKNNIIEKTDNNIDFT